MKGPPNARRFVPFNNDPAIYSKVKNVSPLKFEHYTKRGVLFADPDKHKTCSKLDYNPNHETTVRSLSLGSKNLAALSDAKTLIAVPNFNRY